MFRPALSFLNANSKLNILKKTSFNQSKRSARFFSADTAQIPNFTVIKACQTSTTYNALGFKNFVQHSELSIQTMEGTQVDFKNLTQSGTLFMQTESSGVWFVDPQSKCAEKRQMHNKMISDFIQNYLDNRSLANSLEPTS